MSGTPYFPFYPADYLADTAHLTTEQHGAYLLLLMTAWPRGGRLPNDRKKLARIARVTARRWHLIADDVLDFFREDGDEIVSDRMERDYQKAVSKSEKRSASGMRGGLSKSRKNNKTGLANAKQNPCHLPEPEPDKEANASSSNAREASEIWEQVCVPAELPGILKLTAKRSKSISARIAEHGMAGWRAACVRVASSDFCRGQNDRGWKADIDFLSSPSGFVKVMEGKYDNRSPNNPTDSASRSRRQHWQELISEAEGRCPEGDPGSGFADSGSGAGHCIEGRADPAEGFADRDDGGEPAGRLSARQA